MALLARSSRGRDLRAPAGAGAGPASLAISGHDLLACAAMGIVQIGCGLVAFTAGSRHLPAADLTLLAQTEVVLGPVWAWLGRRRGAGVLDAVWAASCAAAVEAGARPAVEAEEQV